MCSADIGTLEANGASRGSRGRRRHRGTSAVGRRTSLGSPCRPPILSAAPHHSTALRWRTILFEVPVLRADAQSGDVRREVQAPARAVLEPPDLRRRTAGGGRPARANQEGHLLNLLGVHVREGRIQEVLDWSQPFHRGQFRPGRELDLPECLNERWLGQAVSRGGIETEDQETFQKRSTRRA